MATAESMKLRWLATAREHSDSTPRPPSPHPWRNPFQQFNYFTEATADAVEGTDGGIFAVGTGHRMINLYLHGVHHYRTYPCTCPTPRSLVPSRTFCRTERGLQLGHLRKYRELPSFPLARSDEQRNRLSVLKYQAANSIN